MDLEAISNFPNHGWWWWWWVGGGAPGLKAGHLFIRSAGSGARQTCVALSGWGASTSNLLTARSSCCFAHCTGFCHPGGRLTRKHVAWRFQGTQYWPCPGEGLRPVTALEVAVSHPLWWCLVEARLLSLSHAVNLPIGMQKSISEGVATKPSFSPRHWCSEAI
jgi:hypothetical protein